jgi:hypothetical protein
MAVNRFEVYLVNLDPNAWQRNPQDAALFDRFAERDQP